MPAGICGDGRIQKNKTMKIIKNFFLIMLLASCGGVIKKNINIDASDYPIKSIAILPFRVSADTNKLMTGVTAESILRAAKISRYRFQRYLYISFLYKSWKNKLSFQNFMSTNDLLKKADLYEDFSENS